MFTKLLSLLKSSSAYTLGNVLRKALFMVSMPIMTRYLAPGEYGTLSLVNTIAGILLVIYGLGAPSFVMRYYYECDSDDDKQKLLGCILLFVLFFAFFASILASLFGFIAFDTFIKDVPFYPYMLIGIWVCFFASFEILPEALFKIFDQPFYFISVNFSKSVLSIALAITSVVYLKFGAEGPLSASLITSILYAAFFIYYLHDKIKLNFSKRTITNCLFFGGPVVFMLLGRSLIEATDRLALQHFTNLSIVAYYSVASTVGAGLVIVSSSVNSAWIPFFYATAKVDSDYNAKRIFSYASIYFAVIIIFLGLLTVLFRQEIITILAPPSYAPAIAIIPVITLGALAHSFFYIVVRGIYQMKKTVHLTSIILITVIFNICGNFLLVPLFGMMGAAIATVAASLLMMSITFVISQRLYPIPYQYYRLLKVLLAGAICASFSMIPFNLSIYASIIIKLFLVILFPFLLLILHFFEQEELTYIRASIKTFSSKFVSNKK